MGRKQDDKHSHTNEETGHDLKNYLDTVIQASHDGIGVVDSEGRFEFGNEAFFQILGWPKEESLGRHFITVVPPDLHDFTFERWKEVQAGKGAPYEVDIVRKDGSRRNLLVSHRHMTIADRRKYCVVAKDVTESRQAQEALRLLSLITEQVSDSVIATNLDFEITYINRSCERLFGYSREELLGRSPGILNAEPDAERIQNDIYKTVSSGGTWRGELSNRRKDGSTFSCEATVFPLLDDKGNTFAYVGNHRDITERKQAEEALRQSEQRFDLAVRGSRDGLWDWNILSGESTWWSPRLYELLGYQDGEIQADHELWREFLHPDDRDATLKATNANVDNDVPFDAEYRLRTKSGDYRWFRARGITLRDENGEPIRMAGSMQDIEDRKQAEEKLAHYQLHLEEMVQMRTRELTEAQATLRKVHHRLLNVSEAERRRLAGELHDSVGQKLVAMAIAIQQTIMACDDTTAHEGEIQALKNVEKQCTETIREIQTICYGLYPPMLELTGLAGSLRQLGQSCEPAVNFHFQCDDALAEARFDPEHEIALFRMAQEAVSNTLKHGKAANINISLEKKADILTMAIRDDGVGFDTTAQLDQGLGLRSMTERARTVGGTIDITSHPGRTSVEVTLPTAKPPETPKT